MSFVIRGAAPRDAPDILRLIRDLAAYEKLIDGVTNDEAMVRATFFSPEPKAFCEIAESDRRPVGCAIWFYSYSTFTGRHGIYLEDLFVEPQYRGSGIGKAFLQKLAARCVEEDLTRFEWSVLDWNEPSIGFYRSLGARPIGGWTHYRLDGEALAQLGGQPR